MSKTNEGTNPIVIFGLLFICCCVTWYICGALIYAGNMYYTQTTLNTQAASGQLGMATPEVYGLCPTSPTIWLHVPYTNGIYCVDPTAIGVTDKFGNLIGAVKGPTCQEPLKMQLVNGRQNCVNDVVTTAS